MANCQYSSGAWEAVSPPGRVQMLNSGRVHWRKAGNYKCFQGLIMEIPGLLRRFIIIYKEFKFFFHSHVYNVHELIPFFGSFRGPNITWIFSNLRVSTF